MTMVSKGDDQQGEDSLGEKRSFDLLVTLRLPYGDEEIRTRRGKEKQQRKMLMIDTMISAATKTILGKRKIDHNCENQQNPNYRHDYSSSSSSLSLVESKKHHVVSDEPIRAEPIREIKPPVRERNRVVRRKRPVRREPGVTPGWVVDLMREKNGTDVKMIIEKKLKTSDIEEGLSRFLMPFNQIAEMDFLNETELTIIEEHYIKIRNKGVNVMLVDSRGKEWNLNLRRWDMKTSSNYVLCTGWKDVVRSHKLKKDQTIRLWSFHSQDGNKLYFAFAPSDELFLCEETNKILFPFPKRRRTPRVCVPAPTEDSSNLDQSILEGLDLNGTVPQVCTEMAPLDTVQETNRRTSLVSVTETSQVSDTETTTLDLELRL